MTNNLNRRQFMKYIGAGAAVAVLPVAGLAVAEKPLDMKGFAEGLANASKAAKRVESNFKTWWIPLGEGRTLLCRKPAKIKKVFAGKKLLSPDNYKIEESANYVYLIITCDNFSKPSGEIHRPFSVMGQRA